MRCFLTSKTLLAVAMVSTSVCVPPAPRAAARQVTVANILKGTVDVGNFPAKQTVDGTVDVGNFPSENIRSFAEFCISDADICTIDMRGLLLLGDVRIGYLYGAADNVGPRADPGVIPGTEAITRYGLPFQEASLDTGVNRDIVFSQALDHMVWSHPDLRFFENGSSRIRGHVLGHVILDPPSASSPITVPEPGSGILLAGLALLLVPLRRWLQRLTP